MSDVPVIPPLRRRARPVWLAAVAAVALAGCSTDGPASGVQVVVPDTGPGRGASAAGADGEMTLEVPTEADAPPARDPADDAAPVSPPAHLPQASLPAAVAAPDDLPATVAVVGDSLTLSAHDEITAYLTGIGIEVLELDGAVNRRMTRGAEPDPGIDVIEVCMSKSNRL